MAQSPFITALFLPVFLWVAFPAVAQPSFAIDVTITPSTCERPNGSFIAQGSGGTAPYLYAINNRGYSSANEFKNLRPGYYTISAKDAGGLLQSRTILVPNNNWPPRIEGVEKQEPACNGADGSITLRVSGDHPPFSVSLDSLQWREGLQWEGLYAGQYRLLVRDAVGCTSEWRDSLVQACPVRLLPGVVTPACGEDGAVLGLQGAGGEPPYLFSLDGAAFEAVDAFRNLAPGLHLLAVRDAAGSTATYGLQVESSCNFSINTVVQQPVCGSQTGSITVMANRGVPPYRYWLEGRRPPQDDPVFSGLGEGVYTVMAADATGLEAVAVITLVSEGSSGLPASAGNDTAICKGASVRLNGIRGNGQFQWSPATGLDDATSASPLFSPDTTTTYLLTITDGSCPSSDAVTIYVYTLAIDAGKDTLIRKGDKVQLQATDPQGIGISSWHWSPPAGLDDPFRANPVAQPQQDQRYLVEAIASNGCTARDSLWVRVVGQTGIYVPNAFTPNGDGANDRLRPRVDGLQSFAYFKVYNRLGQEVFFTTDPQQGWNGQFGGRDQPPGMYVWELSAQVLGSPPERKKGVVWLIR